MLAGECKPIQVGGESGRAYRRSLLLRRRHPITREKLADERGGEAEVKLPKEESKEEGGGSHAPEESERTGKDAARRVVRRVGNHSRGRADEEAEGHQCPSTGRAAEEASAKCGT